MSLSHRIAVTCTGARLDWVHVSGSKDGKSQSGQGFFVTFAVLILNCSLAMNDMFNMMGKLSEVKDKMEEIRSELPYIQLQEVSDDGLVTVDFTADKQIQQVHVDQQLLTAEKQETLQHQITETVNAAMEKASATYKAKLKEDLQGVLPNIPGLDIENLPF